MRVEEMRVEEMRVEEMRVEEMQVEEREAKTIGKKGCRSSLDSRSAESTIKSPLAP
ncbi:hypothetical protein [Candidatus Symbiopectobacterium sp. NZEC135]|uniref:hypothetical protein n=1 Tax=Candidatus Symbiopectobacterium sp. NZEC135 TaxID=2820471 RepID=UPI0022272FBD|nr:hypothetical protein [Candidatus Symbiopectobacterium sp. NZEC135]MCW2479927.1 hypothetical protein [Candidatus Symbiopectobacterium sp. NZEC135]